MHRLGEHVFEVIAEVGSVAAFLALTLGWLVRGLHFWGANFIVVAAAVHLLRVFFYASYKSPREVTWWTGVMMLLLVLAGLFAKSLANVASVDLGMSSSSVVTFSVSPRMSGRDRSK